MVYKLRFHHRSGTAFSSMGRLVDSLKLYLLSGTCRQNNFVLEQGDPGWILSFKSWMRFFKFDYTAADLPSGTLRNVWCQNGVKWKVMLGILGNALHVIGRDDLSDNPLSVL